MFSTDKTHYVIGESHELHVPHDPAPPPFLVLGSYLHAGTRILHELRKLSYVVGRSIVCIKYGRTGAIR